MLTPDKALPHVLCEGAVRGLSRLFSHTREIQAGLLHQTRVDLTSQACFPHAISIGFVNNALEILMPILERLP